MSQSIDESTSKASQVAQFHFAPKRQSNPNPRIGGGKRRTVSLSTMSSEPQRTSSAGMSCGRTQFIHNPCKGGSACRALQRSQHRPPSIRAAARALTVVHAGLIDLLQTIQPIIDLRGRRRLTCNGTSGVQTSRPPGRGAPPSGSVGASGRRLFFGLNCQAQAADSDCPAAVRFAAFTAASIARWPLAPLTRSCARPTTMAS